MHSTLEHLFPELGSSPSAPSAPLAAAGATSSAVLGTVAAGATSAGTAASPPPNISAKPLSASTGGSAGTDTVTGRSAVFDGTAACVTVFAAGAVATATTGITGAG